jgi:hypothetical protein
MNENMINKITFYFIFSKIQNQLLEIYLIL